MENYANERDKAFIDFVKTGSLSEVNAFCKKYGLYIPKSEDVQKAGIYKAVQYCNNIPEDVKAEAYIKCLELGFFPYITPIEAKEGAENG